MIPLIASAAASAYARTAIGAGVEAVGGIAAEAGQGFAAALGRAMEGVVHAGRDADTQSVRAIGGAGNLTEVATAVSRAELALQGAVAVRDKVVQAYQDVMRMPI